MRLVTAVGSKLSTTGEHFSATVARPVEVDGKVVVPPGTEALGKIVEAVPQGRFKGAAVLRLVLETVTVKNDSYDVKTSSVSRYLKGKGKRTATLIGGGAKTSECFRVQNELHVRSVRPSDLVPTNALT